MQANSYKANDFAQLCLDKNITQTPSPPYDPNKNPVGHYYMEIIVSMSRSMLFVSGLNPDGFWEHAIEHATQIQNRTALPGRTTPYEITYGRRPNVSSLLKIFGCEALCYVEKDKRAKTSTQSRAYYLPRTFPKAFT
jgi:hypothetical protein